MMSGGVPWSGQVPFLQPSRSLPLECHGHIVAIFLYRLLLLWAEAGTHTEHPHTLLVQYRQHLIHLTTQHNM